jgi:hypothetical protein
MCVAAIAAPPIILCAGSGSAISQRLATTATSGAWYFVRELAACERIERDQRTIQIPNHNGFGA